MGKIDQRLVLEVDGVVYRGSPLKRDKIGKDPIGFNDKIARMSC